jgi:hypothetical protein
MPRTSPLLGGGATVCTLLPVTIHEQPVAFGLGGALERVRPLQQRYAALLRRAALSVQQPATRRQLDAARLRGTIGACPTPLLPLRCCALPMAWPPSR